MRKPRAEMETFSLSFLDVISCGFGAMILLLIIVLAFEPTNGVQIADDLQQKTAGSEAARQSMAAEYLQLKGELETKKQQLAQIQARLSALGMEWQMAEKQLGTAQASAQLSVKVQDQLQSVQQTLSEELKKLLSQSDVKINNADAPIGGIPVDSRFLIFIIDTSGSMKVGAWPLVVQKMQEILETYPKVEGIQIMNDQGSYMFPTYAGQWIPDSPARRAVVLDRLKTWNVFSASNPAPGIAQAIRTFYDPNRPTSIFVFGDDFNGPNIDEVVRTVARSNRRGTAAQPLIRIHTFGFPVLPLLTKQQENFTRFAHLMRLLAEQNSGSFVGLPTLR